MTDVLFDYDKPDAEGATCTAHAWAKVPAPLQPAERDALKARARALLAQHNAVLVAHYYVDPDLQDLAVETGGCVADSLEMARFGRDHPAQTLVVAGVRFMGETAKILSPRQARADAGSGRHLLAGPGLPGRRLHRLLRRPPRPHGGGLCQYQRGGEGACRLDGHQLGRAGSWCASEGRGEKIIWAPDRYLGITSSTETGADMLLWNGACIVHDEFKGLELELLREQHPAARCWCTRNPRPGHRTGRRGGLDQPGCSTPSWKLRRARSSSSPPTRASSTACVRRHRASA
jgi:quinolinate synthase